MIATRDSVDYDLKLAEFKINGYVVLDNMIPTDTVDEIRSAFLPLLEHVMARETKESRTETGEVRTGLGRLQTAKRYTLTLPWLPPFSDPAIYEHPVILEFLKRYWGTDDFLITCYHSNTPAPGSAYQTWHRDTRIVSDIPHIGLETCPALGIKFPLLDTSEENGSIEVLPSTQYLADPSLETEYNQILTKGDFPSAQRLNLKKGSMWIQDIRTLHRGTPNNSDQPRPELVICFCRSWWRISQNVDVPRAAFDRLSERGKQLLARCNIVDWN